MSQDINLYTDLDGFRVDIFEEKARADVVLDRPPLNIVSMQQREQFAEVFRALSADDRVRVIVIRSEGQNFSSGGDIKGFMAATPEKVSHLANNIKSPELCPKPVIAAVRGYCFGVGFELSLACDFRIASDTAQFALPEQRIGMIPGSGGSIRLLHMIGMARTKDLVMRSRRLSGRQALEWGVVIDCVPDDELEATVDAFVQELVEFSPLAQRTIKQVLNTAEDATLHVGIEMEGLAYGRLRMSNDFAEGVESFHAKRKPSWTGS
jgi:2-oxoglutaroyl-CoA hydrolase